MPNVGPMELLVVLVLALLILGPKRLPEVGRSLGRGLREFKDTLSGAVDDDDEPEPPPLTEAERETERETAASTRTTSSR